MDEKKEKKELSGADKLCGWITGAVFFALAGILIYNEIGPLEFGGPFGELAGQALGVLICTAVQGIAGAFGKVIYEGIARALFLEKKENYVWGAARLLTVYLITLAVVWFASVGK